MLATLSIGIATLAEMCNIRIDILQTTEKNEFDKEFANLDAATFEGLASLNPFMDNDKYQQDDGRGNVATGQSVGLSSGKEIAPPVISGR
jgi:hypothetical protein